MTDTNENDRPDAGHQSGHEPSPPGGHDHGGHGHVPVGPPGWFDKPKNNRRFLAVFYVLCAATLLVELFTHRHEELSIEGKFGFYGVYGFFGIVLLVVISVQLRKLVMRPEDYYER